VYTSERDFVEAVVRGVRVQNALPTGTATAPATEPPPSVATPPPEPPPTSPPVPSPTVPLVALPPAPTLRPTAGPAQSGGWPGLADLAPGGDAIGRAFWFGVQLTFIIFGILGGYLLLRAGVSWSLKALERQRRQRPPSE
jgi:hypothetical protein